MALARRISYYPLNTFELRSDNKAIKASGFISEIFRMISLSLIVKIFCRRIPLSRSRGVRSILLSSLTKNASSNILEVIWRQTTSPLLFSRSVEITSAGRILEPLKSVNGNWVNTISRCLYSPCYFFFPYSSSHRLSSVLFQASLSEGSDTIVTSSTGYCGTTVIPISRATLMSNASFSGESVSMKMVVFILSKVELFIRIRMGHHQATKDKSCMQSFFPTLSVVANTQSHPKDYGQILPESLIANMSN